MPWVSALTHTFFLSGLVKEAAYGLRGRLHKHNAQAEVCNKLPEELHGASIREKLENLCQQGASQHKTSGETWFSCPICFPYHPDEPLQLWIHAKNLDPVDRYTIVKFRFGDEGAHSDKAQSCADFTIEGPKDPDGLLSSLDNLGAYKKTLLGKCNDVSMKDVARWVGGFIKALQKCDRELGAKDSSYFVCPGIKTLPLRVLTSGRTLYQSFFNDSTQGRFAYDEDYCAQQAEKIYQEAPQNVKDEVQRFLKKAKIIKSTHSFMKESKTFNELEYLHDRCAKLVAQYGNIIGPLAHLFNFSDRCELFYVDVDEANLALDF